jgi:hypothetical protein
MQKRIDEIEVELQELKVSLLKLKRIVENRKWYILGAFVVGFIALCNPVHSQQLPAKKPLTFIVIPLNRVSPQLVGRVFQLDDEIWDTNNSGSGTTNTGTSNNNNNNTNNNSRGGGSTRGSGNQRSGYSR